MPAFARLRWQLTLSHLLATAFTLVSMIAALVLLAATWFASQGQAAGAREAAQDARNIARSISGVVESGADASALNPILHALAAGSLHGVVAFGPRSNPFDSGLQNVAYLALVDARGTPLASSDPAGAAFAPPERNEWLAVTAPTDPNGTAILRDRATSGPVALGGAPILDAGSRLLGTVVVAKSSLAPAGGGFDALRGLTIFGAASLAVLMAASIFALICSSIVAYLLSRRLVTRLERLGRAAEALAAGDLTSRVELESASDEVGQLSMRFNAMAADLEHSLGELRAERDRVAGLLESRRQLIATASHELRTPVATVRGYLESVLARSEALAPDLRGDLATMERELTRLQALIDDLFALAQAEVGRLSIRLEPTDVNLVVRRLVETAAPLAWHQRRVQVIADTEPYSSLAIADRQRLEQIVSNLLSNAIRHTPPGGLVSAGVSTEDGRINVVVRDTGDGVPAEDLPHVFERFFRGRGSNGQAGAGLGLALVKELTEAMGGAVEVANTPTEGSCFIVHLQASA